MSSDPLPDHYKALGVEKTADAATIKSVYRKLVLKCHPDKVTDPELKEEKQKEFHKIQEAYEVLVDDQKRGDYEARLTLEALRKEKAARTAASGDKSTRFAGGASYMSSGSSRYATEERKPARAYDEDDRYYEERSRKYDTYPAYPKNGSSPRSKESPSKGGRPSASDRTRSERTKTRDREARSDRKFVSVESESSSDEKEKFATEYRRRSAEVEARKASDSRRKAEDRRSYEDPRYGSASRKMSAQEDEAIRYQHKSRTQVESETRPSIPRTSSRDYFVDSRSSRKESSRPEAVRRSSARPKERQGPVPRIIPEIVDWSEHRAPPSFKHSASSPANIEIPRSVPLRTQTDTGREFRHVEATSPPSFSRSTTMPSVPRRKESGAPRASGLREAMTPEQSTTEQEGFPFVPPPQSSSVKTKYYHYPTPGGGVPLRQEDILGSASSHRTILREPERHRHRSPSPLTRPPIGPNRPSESSTPPTMSRSSTSRHLSPSRAAEPRGRSKENLYGEVNGSRGRQASYNSGNVQFSRKYGPEDVRWASRSQESEREYASKPTMGRTATFVY